MVDYELLLKHVKIMCKNNIKYYENLQKSGTSTDCDMGQSHAFYRILNFIEEIERGV